MSFFGSIIPGGNFIDKALGIDGNNQQSQPVASATQEPQASVKKEMANGEKIEVKGSEKFVRDYPMPGNTSSAGAFSSPLASANTGTSSDDTKTVTVQKGAKVTVE